MSTTMKTPGVYIQELDAFGNSVVPVPTAIPVFIGYTKNTSFKGKNLIRQAIKISSLADFLTFYGNEAPPNQFTIVTEEGANGYTINSASTVYRLFGAMHFFYANGGADCYVMSIGGYDNPMKADDFTKAITLLKKESEPTMLVIPDAIELKSGNEGDPFEERYKGAYGVQNAMINHCGADMPNRVAILDIPGGYSEPEENPTASVDAFRSNVSPIIPKSNSYAAAYYPWLHTSVYQEADISYKNLDDASFAILNGLLRKELAASLVPKVDVKGELDVMISYLTASDPESTIEGIVKYSELSDDKKKEERESAHAAIKIQSKSYNIILTEILNNINLMAPSAAMAGIYTAVDNADGVWKAPANVAIQNVIAPAIKIDHHMQQDLNVPINGKSVCAIRSFTGRGILVWGARTLDGNSNDWRYINVRRTLIYIEQSVKDAAKAYVFDANDANTWVNVKSMISNFLTNVWKQGGLVGPKPADAFSVSVGLGVTMSNDDIQNGIMRVSVKVALSHPAEFIEITFQQQQQKA